jgi:hypothetical protein
VTQRNVTECDVCGTVIAPSTFRIELQTQCARINCRSDVCGPECLTAYATKFPHVFSKAVVS